MAIFPRAGLPSQLEQVVWVIPPLLNVCHHLRDGLNARTRGMRVRSHTAHATHLVSGCIGAHISFQVLNCGPYSNRDSYSATFADAPGRFILFCETRDWGGQRGDAAMKSTGCFHDRRAIYPGLGI